MIVLSLVLAMSAAPSAPQQANPSYPGAPVMGRPAVAMSNRDFNNQMQRRIEDRRMRDHDRESGEAEERRARAERLVPMVNAGQCTQAIAIAQQEGDADMALRLEAACSRIAAANAAATATPPPAAPQ